MILVSYLDLIFYVHNIWLLIVIPIIIKYIHKIQIE